MNALSQIVGEGASLFDHSLCVARNSPSWQFVAVSESDAFDDKNGGPNNLRAWREHRKLSQAALAEKVHTTANMIQYLESGERGLSLKWLRRLAPALETTVGMLADYEPGSIDMEMHELFVGSGLAKEERVQLYKIARALKSGTDDR